MPPRPRDKRARLIDAAVKLVHRQGFHRTTLAELAKDSHVPLGNVYYYFQTKEALGDALIERYVTEYAAVREQWEAAESDPAVRLGLLIQMTIDQKDVLARSGCPMGTLSSELHKEGGPLAEHMTELYAALLDWTERQVRQLGPSRAEAHGCALHLLAALEGARSLAYAFGEPKYAVQEAQRLREWVNEMRTAAKP